MKFSAVPSAFLRRAQFEALDDLQALVEAAEGDLVGVEAEALADLAVGLVAGYEAARAAAATDADVEALTRVANAIELVGTENSRRADEAAARDAALAALDGRVAEVLGSDAEGEATEGADDGAVGEAESGEGEGAPAADEAAAAPVDAPDAERQVASSAPRASLAGLARFRRSDSVPAAGPSDGNDFDPLSRLTAGAAMQSLEPNLGAGGRFRTLDQMGRAVERLHRSLKVHNPGERRHYVGSVPLSDAASRRMVNLDEMAKAGGTDGAFDRATEIVLAERREAAASRADGRLVASGGSCAVHQPDYTVSLVGERGTPFVSGLPTVTGSRPMSFYPWVEVDMTSAARRQAPFAPDVDPFAATGHVTNAQDLAGYVSSSPAGPTPDKDCVHITCVGNVNVNLDATYRCVTVGNFVARAFPEWVEVFDRYTLIGFDDKRETVAQTAVRTNAAAKEIVAANEFGAAVDLLGSIRILAASIRATRRAPSLPIDVYLPAFAADMLAQDIATAMFGGELRITASQALGLLGTLENIFVETYQASWGATAGGDPTVLPKQLAGNLNDWPEEILVGVWPTGTVGHQQGWELSFGLTEVGKDTNDVSTFAELAEATFVRGTDLYFLNQTLCVSGARGGAIVKTCAPVI